MGGPRQLTDFPYSKLKNESFVSSSLKALNGQSFAGPVLQDCPALQDCPSFEEQDCQATATRWKLTLD